LFVVRTTGSGGRQIRDNETEVLFRFLDASNESLPLENPFGAVIPPGGPSGPEE